MVVWSRRQTKRHQRVAMRGSEALAASKKRGGGWMISRDLIELV